MNLCVVHIKYLVLIDYQFLNNRKKSRISKSCLFLIIILKENNTDIYEMY